MARFARYVWPALATSWLIAAGVAVAGAGPGVVGSALVLPAMLLAAVAFSYVSIVDTSGRTRVATGVRMARRTRTVTVLRSCDPDAAGRPRPRAPGA